MTETLRLGLLVVFSVCLLVSGFLSGSETALTAVPRERIHQLASNGRRGRRLAALANDLEGSIGTILVANNFVNILATSVAATIAMPSVCLIRSTSLTPGPPTRRITVPTNPVTANATRKPTASSHSR